MMRTIPDEISNSQKVIDSRDVIARIEHLQDAIESAAENDPENTLEDERDELTRLEALADEADGSPDWTHGEMLIADHYFTAYAQELAEDCDMIDSNARWPNTCIDWEKAAGELQQDYTSVDFGGETYWIRS